MYASFFGLRELPFNNTPDPRFFFSTPDHEEAMASLIYAVNEGKGFVLLTGEVGSGKTLVTRLMLRHFGDRISFAAISNTQLSAYDLLQAMCAEYGIDAAPNASSAELVRRLQDYLLHCFGANKPAVLMLDEAQALSREAFEQVRMIGNLEADDAKLLQIVIVGQPELKERFEARDMRQLRQRIFRSFHLSALNREQAEGYIRHRLSVAGAPYPDRVFDGSALDAIFEHSQGLPRLINAVCDNAMLSAYAADQHTIDRPFVTHVIEQMLTVAQGATSPPSKLSAALAATPPAAIESGAPTTAPTTAPNVAMTPAPAASTQALEQRLRSEFATRLEEVQGDYTRRLGAEIERIRAEIAESQELATAAVPDSAGVQKLTRQLRNTAADARRAAGDLRDAIARARSTRATTDESVARLVGQSARTSKLCVSLRAVFDRLEARADEIDRRVQSGTVEAVVAPSEMGSRVLQKARALDNTITTNRGSVSEMRSVITALADSTRPSAPVAGPNASCDERARTSQLADQVRELNDLIMRKPGVSSVAG